MCSSQKCSLVIMPLCAFVIFCCSTSILFIQQSGAVPPGAGRMEDVLMMCLESKKGGPQGRSHVCAESLTSQLGGQGGRHPSKILSLFPAY